MGLDNDSWKRLQDLSLTWNSIIYEKFPLFCNLGQTQKLTTIRQAHSKKKKKKIRICSIVIFIMRDISDIGLFYQISWVYSIQNSAFPFYFEYHIKVSDTFTAQAK